MGVGDHFRRPLRAAALVAVGAAGAAAAVAVATVPDSAGVIHACYPVAITENAGGVSTIPANTANLRVIDPSAGQQCSTVAAGGPQEQALSWNVTGPKGDRGLNGRSVTVLSGHTLTIAGGQVITVGGQAPGITIDPFSNSRGSHVLGTMVIDNGQSPLSFNPITFLLAGHAAGGGGGGGGGAGKVKFNEFTITKQIDKASPSLFKNCVSGAHYKKVTLTLRKSGGGQKGAGKAYLVYTFKTVFVSAISQSHGGDRPQESITFSFGKVSIDYNPK